MKTEYEKDLQKKVEEAVNRLDDTLEFLWQKNVNSPWREKSFWLHLIDKCLDKRIQITDQNTPIKMDGQNNE